MEIAPGKTRTVRRVGKSLHTPGHDLGHTVHTACTALTSASTLPQSPAEARCAPDAVTWVVALDKELDKLDTKEVMQWIPPGTAPRSSPIPPTIAYMLKKEGNKTSLKHGVPRAATLGCPKRISTPRGLAPMAFKHSIRLLVAFSAAHNLSLEHFV